MRLTVYTDFSLRVLMYLALHRERRPTIAEIAASYGVSRNHLMKVVHQLGVGGYVASARGKAGGLRLAREPADIGVGEVVRRTEPDMALVPCLDRAGGSCVIAPACRLRSVLDEARCAFLQALDRYSIADLVADPAPLNLLLEQGRSGKA